MSRVAAKSELIFAYSEALGLTSIRIMTEIPAGRLSWLEVDLEARPEAPDSAGRAVFDTLWFPKSDHAELVLAQVLAALAAAPGTPIDMVADQARDTVTDVATSLGAEWRTTAEVFAAAEQAIDQIERHITALNASGGLKQINAAYKKYRLAMQTTAEKAMSYSEYFQSYKLRIVKIVAGNAATGRGGVPV